MPRSRTPPPAPVISAPLAALHAALAEQTRAALPFRSHIASARPTRVAAGVVDLLVSGDPSGDLGGYGRVLGSAKAGVVVRCCQPAYAADAFGPGVRVVEAGFEEGGVPDARVVASFLHVLDTEFGLRGADDVDWVREGGAKAVAVHCEGGLGRAPVLAALALIEVGFEVLDAVAVMRAKRRGAINGRQFGWLMEYRKRRDAVVAPLGGRRSSSLGLGLRLPGLGRGRRVVEKEGVKKMKVPQFVRRGEERMPVFGRLVSAPVGRS